MTPERWQRIDRVLQAVLARAEAERPAALAELSEGDERLRLGVGGMGEVYRVHDATLGRDVAIKILLEPWLTDPERRARFEREAKLLASLNHSNVGAGVHESDGVRALVLELVEGETLAERIARQAEASEGRRGLPIDDVIVIARQLTDALKAAHERGIVHRDLKPANIKITPDMRVKVLDFGLGRALTGTDSEPDTRSGPCVNGPATQGGRLLGTAAYMSPEQARGRPVDKRTDIWAFGCVLYEMPVPVARECRAGLDSSRIHDSAEIERNVPRLGERTEDRAPSSAILR